MGSHRSTSRFRSSRHIAILGVHLPTLSQQQPQGVQKVVSEAIFPSRPKAQNQGEAGASNCKGKPVCCPDVYASWCSGPVKKHRSNPLPAQQKLCRSRELRCFDVSDKGLYPAKSEATARKLGLSKFLCCQQNQTVSCTIIDPATAQRSGRNLSSHTTKQIKPYTKRFLTAAISRK